MLGRCGGAADSTEAVGRDGGGSSHRGRTGGGSLSYVPSCRVLRTSHTGTGPILTGCAWGLRVRVRPGAGTVRQLRDVEGMGGMAGDDWATTAPSPAVRHQGRLAWRFLGELKLPNGPEMDVWRFCMAMSRC